MHLCTLRVMCLGFAGALGLVSGLPAAARAAPGQAPSSSSSSSSSPRPAPARPATGKPATEKPAAAAADQAKTPKGALKLLAVALHKGDGKQIRDLLYAADETEQKMVAAMADMAAALAKLHKAAVKAFGEDGARDLTGDAGADPAGEIKRIEAAKVEVDGETATVTYEDEEADNDNDAGDNDNDDTSDGGSGGADGSESGRIESFEMKKVDGRWRVPLSELRKGAGEADVEQTLADMAGQTKLIGELTEDIKAGRYPNAEKAAEAWRAKIYALPRKPADRDHKTKKEDDRKGGAGEGTTAEVEK